MCLMLMIKGHPVLGEVGFHEVGCLPFEMAWVMG